MSTESNATGMARIGYLIIGLAAAGWAIWGGGADWMKWTALVIGGILLVLAIIGYSPVHAMFGAKGQKAG
jgi:hypothetical protein